MHHMRCKVTYTKKRLYTTSRIVNENIIPSLKKI